VIVRRARVLRGAELAGHIERSARGAAFTYDAAYVERTRRQRTQAQVAGIAHHLPLEIGRVETVGVNLHTFFAGLLPEGLRLQALVRRAKTSPDDLLSLLVSAGADCAGDISVIADDALPASTSPAVDVAHLDAVSFAEVFAESIEPGKRRPQEPVVAGVQQKISAAMISLPLRARGRRASSYILKLNPPATPRLVENESFFMRMAADVGLRAAKARLVRDRDGASGLLVERFDRALVGDVTVRLHQEDACQLLDRYPADKYAVATADVARAIQGSCDAPIVQLLRFLELVAFSYLIGNGDPHAKNVSVLTARGTPRTELSPAYDLLSTVPYGDHTMALPIDRRDDRIRRRTLVEFGTRFGVRAAATEAMLDRLVDRAPPHLAGLDVIGLDAKKTAALRSTISKRRDDLGVVRIRGQDRPVPLPGQVDDMSVDRIRRPSRALTKKDS